MQAAEAYAAKSRASRSNSGSGGPGPAGPSVGTGGGGGGTWSAGSLSSNRGRSRPQLTNETFQRPPSRGYNSRPASRTTSASPGPLRRRQPSDLESKQSSSRYLRLSLTSDAGYILFQTHSLLHQLTQNMTTDCLLSYKFSSRKLKDQYKLCTYIKLFFDIQKIVWVH